MSLSWLRRVVCVLALLQPALSSAAERPNVVFILADDLGYGDVRVNNTQRGRIATPNLDRLAASGMRFTDGHSSSAVCSPSRYTLLTGRFHWRTRLQRGIVGLWERPLIDPDRLTVAGLLKQKGYTTACIGKWHLGWDWPIDQKDLPLFRDKVEATATAEHVAKWKAAFSQPIAGGPTTRGFDRYFGTDVPNWPPYCFIDNDRTIGIPSEFLPPVLLRQNQASIQGPALKDWTLEPILPALGDQAVRFVTEAAGRRQPFFLYLPLTTPHTPIAVNEKWRGKSGLNNEFADLVMETDDVVGRVLKSLDDAGVTDNTLVLFTADNGCAPYIDAAGLEKQGHFPSGPFRGYKSDAWEGGHRVPFFVRWPGHVRPGSTCDQLVHHADMIATIAEIVGVPLAPNQAEDSFSLLPLLAGGTSPIRDFTINQSANGLSTIRQGSWKLIFGKGSGGWGKGSDEHPAQLYDLSTDIAETTNHYADKPDVVARLTTLMEQIVDRGSSRPGASSKNDVPVDWRKFMTAARSQ
jgi:arylsulfatase A